MNGAVNRLIAGVVTGGAIVCLLAALTLRPVPFFKGGEAKWATIRQSWQTQGAPGSYSLDTVVINGRHLPYDNKPQTLRPGDSFSLIGWVFDPNFRRTADRFVYRIDGGAWQDAAYHIARSDVAAALHLPRIADCGFVVTLLAASMTPGRHLLEFATIEGLAPPVPLTATLTLNVSAR